MIKNSLRLQNIAKLLNFSDVTVDVGCDHGFVTLHILQNNIAKHVVATDISAKCLDKTRALVTEAGLSHRATFIATDGLIDVDKPNIDQIVIAGMGGSTIMHILQHMHKSCKSARLILQPMNNIMNLRLFLSKMGYAFEHDMIVAEDARYYHIMVVYPGKSTLDETQLHCGAVPSDYTSPDYISWCQHTIAKLQDILQSLPSANPRRLKFMRGVHLLSSIIKGD